MNWSSWLLWGFVATVVLTTLLAGSQGLGITRMNVPYLLGTMVTPNRDRAKLIGVLLHFINGWLFSLIYVAAFQLLGRSTWWFGGLIGLVHGSFVLAVALPALPALHPPWPMSSTGRQLRGNWSRLVFSGCITAFAHLYRSSSLT
jgi:uncharacterized membrane protein YagU involved in acid resistance